MRINCNRLAGVRYSLLAAAVVGFELISNNAFAQAAGTNTSLGGATTFWNGQIKSFATTLLAGAFFIGVALVASGLYKLKKASEENSREGYGPGIWACGIGGALASLSLIATLFQGTASPTGTSAVSETGALTFTN